MQNFDYSKTMVMKIKLALPDNKGDSIVYYTFEETLDIIKKVDNITCGVPKVIYLVGWQYLGHDDNYPAFFEVNKYLKRKQDATAKDSLVWLMTEAKKYNTTVSLHINISDAYSTSDLYQEYADNDLIVKNIFGKQKVTGVWNDRKSYQVCLTKEYETGYFQKRVDKLFDYLPILKELGTIHIDAFFVHRGKGVSAKDEKATRIKMIEYFNAKGVDVTSEFIYREKNCGLRVHYGKSDCIYNIPFYWNPVFSKKDLLKYPAKSVASGPQCNALSMNKNLEWLYYGNIHGENLFDEHKDNWYPHFIKEFVAYNLPYFYLNNFDRQQIIGHGKNMQLIHSNNVISTVKNKSISQNNVVLKENNNVCLPIYWKKDCYMAYCESNFDLYANGKNCEIYQIDENSCNLIGEYPINNGIIDFKPKAKTLYLIQAKGE